MRRCFFFLIGLQALWCSHVVAWQMEIDVSEDLSTIEVTVSHDMGPLEALSSQIWNRLEILENAERRSGLLVPIDDTKPVRYRVGLQHTGAQWAIARWHAPLRITDWRYFLLTPHNWSMRNPFVLTVRVPDGLGAALPFTLVRHVPGEYRYRAYPILPAHGGVAILGNVSLHHERLVGEQLGIWIVGDDTEETQKLLDWVTVFTYSVDSVHRGLPGESANIFIVPIPFVRGVVPWAHVRRGGGSHIIAYVKEGAEPAELHTDWTLFHEMTHLYHPYLNAGGRWVSEGFASYYQNLYRAEARVVDSDYAWQRLKAGMERGRKENEKDGFRPVKEGGRMRTYWTGAAMALEADLQLQEISGGKLTLATVMGRFARRSLPTHRTWHPRDYLAAMDRDIGEPLLVPLYDRYVREKVFPEVAAKREDWFRLLDSI